MKTEQDLLQEYHAAVQSLRMENSIRAALPAEYREDASICLHNGFASVNMWNSFRTTKTLADAQAVLAMFPEVVTAEHWKDGCVSCWPAEINSNAKKESAVMDGSHEVEIKVAGGRGFGPDVEVRFWTRIGDKLVEICCPVSDCRELVPHVRASYNNDGELSKCDIIWPSERAVFDSFRSFWSQKPAFSGSYYMAEVGSFTNWAANRNTTHNTKTQ